MFNAMTKILDMTYDAMEREDGKESSYCSGCLKPTRAARSKALFGEPHYGEFRSACHGESLMTRRGALKEYLRRQRTRLLKGAVSSVAELKANYICSKCNIDVMPELTSSFSIFSFHESGLCKACQGRI